MCLCSTLIFDTQTAVKVSHDSSQPLLVLAWLTFLSPLLVGSLATGAIPYPGTLARTLACGPGHLDILRAPDRVLSERGGVELYKNRLMGQAPTTCCSHPSLQPPCRAVLLRQ